MRKELTKEPINITAETGGMNICWYCDGSGPTKFNDLGQANCKDCGVFRNIGYNRCKLDGCQNAARYCSGYCGIHDITENEGKGQKI